MHTSAIFILVCVYWTVSVHGHGYLTQPASRNYYANLQQTFWNHMSGNGGVGNIPGPCGDNYQGMVTNFAATPSPVQATYTQGQDIEIKVLLTSNHGGKFYFRICNRQSNLDDACFGSNYLTRVDNGQRDTWLTNQDNWVMQYRLPANLSCADGCVLQWWWMSMQSCIEQGCSRQYCGDYADGRNVVYGSSPGWCYSAPGKPEFFANCADIRILPSDAPPGTPPPAPGPAPNPPPPPPASENQDDNYAQVLGYSYLFYEAQQTGQLPSWNRLLYGSSSEYGTGYKKNAHLTDGADVQQDLSGGWYDAGDQIKCPHPMGWTLANMALSAMEYKETYRTFGEWENAKRSIGWGIEWMVKAHLTASDNPTANVFVAQVSGSGDHSYFGRPEHNPTPRPTALVNSATGGADIAGEYAAAFAAAAIVFKGEGNSSYASMLFKRAEQAFAFAVVPTNQKNYGGSAWLAYRTYSSEGWKAHVAWAAAFMCKYSASYCPAAEQWWNTARASTLGSSFGYDWDSVLPGAAAVLATLNTGVSTAARDWLETFVMGKWQNTNSRCPAAPYSTVCYTAKGLAWYSEWGTLRNTNNAIFLAALMGKNGATAASRQQHACWARRQMRYTLGSWGSDRSYVIGYGTNWPQRPHHRQTACAATYSEPCVLKNGGTCCAGESGTGAGGCCDSANFMSSHPALITLWGGLVGGPDQNDVYPDVRNDYKMSEVAVDYNAGLTGASAGLAYLLSSGALTSCGAGPGAPPPSSPPSSPPSTTPTPAPPGTPPPSPPPPSGPCSASVPAWSKCGGQDSSCPAAAGSCTDAPWANHCCPSGHSCQRENAWWWACRPGTAPPPAASPSPPPSNPPATPPPVPTPPPTSPPSPPPSTTPTPPPPPGTCIATVAPWTVCGGLNSNCPSNVASCQDAAWPGYCCQSGYSCRRDNSWWWMCTPNPTPPPPPPAPTCSNAIQAWSQCGGRSSSCPAAAGSCTDTPWQNHCCVGGYACMRDSEWWWACKPAATTSSAAAALVVAAAAAAATPGQVSAAASTTTAALQRELVDILVADVPARAPVKGPVFVTLTLNRQGSPVARARVYVQITTTSKGKSTTTTLRGVTRGNGTAKVAIPPRARGVARSKSVVEAFTSEARAQGAKGDVPVLSARNTITWT